MSNEPVPEKKPQSIMKKNETLTETPIEEEMELEQQYPTKSSEAKNFPVEIRVQTAENDSSSGTFARDDELSKSVSERMIDKIERRGSLLKYKKAARDVDRSDRSEYYLNTTQQISDDVP